MIGSDTGFTDPRRIEVPISHHTDRGGLLALLMSVSVVAAASEPDREEARRAFAAVLARHEIGVLELPFTAQLALAERV